MFPRISWCAAAWFLICHFLWMYARGPCWFSPPGTILDGTYLWVAVVMFVLPFVKVLKYRGLEIDFRGQATEGTPFRPRPAHVPVPVPSGLPGRRDATEYKILNTLWVKQVNKFPELVERFSMKIVFPVGRRLSEYSAAVAALHREGLIGVRPDKYVYLTDEGLQYCNEHYQEFPTDLWFGPIELDEQRLAEAQTALANLTSSSPGV